MRLVLALLAVASLLTSPARAQTLPADLVTLEVLPGWRTGEDQHMAALRLTLTPGWKTYWRNPGAAGLAPVFDFSNSTGIAAAAPRWPVPHVFYFNGMRSIGYSDAVTIPLDITLQGGPVHLAGEVEIGVCDEICVPVRLAFSADLPGTESRDPVIVAALGDRPLTAQEAGVQATCGVRPSREGLGLTIRLVFPPLGADEVVVVEPGDASLWISEAASAREGNTLVVATDVLARDGGTPAVDRSRLRITVLAEGQAVDIQGCQAG